MIIEHLSINNFRVFKGLHNISLTPRSNANDQHKPIILFGGLNGAGKTSILTAIRIALYGRAAFGFNMTQAQYQEQLTSLINHASKPDEATTIELSFNYNENGEQFLYKIIRKWNRYKADKLYLYRNEEHLSNLTYDQCQAFLNELIPAGIADLFFFDGEKIATLAEDKSGTVLQTAIKRLLGLDTIERLKNDLNIFLRPHQSQAMPNNIKKQIEQLENEKANLEKEADEDVNKADELSGTIENINIDINSINNKIMGLGGAWAKTKKQEEARVEELRIKKQKLEIEIRKEMETSLPLALAPKELNQLLKTLDIEAQIKQKQAFTTELNNYLAQIKQKLAKNNTAATIATNAIEQTFADYQQNQTTLQLDLSERERAQITHQIKSAATNSHATFNDIKQALQQTQQQLDNAAINIERAPDDKRIAELLEQLNNLNTQKTIAFADKKSILTQAKQKIVKAIDLSYKIQNLHNQFKQKANQDEAIKNAAATNHLLDEFAIELTKLKMEQLEAEFIKSYQKLTRKEDAGLTAKIDTATYDVELFDENEYAINRKDLSAGEKQIYAIAILEALGKTSGRKLPIIIDTPLGRLDSKHRNKLVETYFPNASHQVVILSTDTEIDINYFNSEPFSKSISHAYEIKYDQTTKTSSLTQGYFWQPETIQEAV